MHLNYLAFAVPLFVGFMLLEYFMSLRRKKQFFHFDEAVANINVGIAERVSDLFTTGLFYFVFDWIYHHYALFSIKSGIATWILLFLLTDFIWYWYHRLGHEVNLLWGFHVVHHQSEDFNYTVSVRITVLQAFARGFFWSILPLIGFPPEMTTIMLLIHEAYPFFTHTQMIGKLGFLEYFLVTPSHHRVHHSSNPEYLDKNYGDVLIIWDKLFGTFAEEKTQPVYGLTKPLGSYSFLWQHFHFLLEIAIAFKRAGSWRERLAVLLGKPDHIDPRIRLYLEKKLLKNSSHRAPGRVLKSYIRSQSIFNLLLLFLILLFESYLNRSQLVMCSMFLLVSLINTGAMLEQKQWIFHLDFLRVGMAGIIVYLFYPNTAVGMVTMMVLTVVVLYYRSISARYYGVLYRS